MGARGLFVLQLRNLPRLLQFLLPICLLRLPFAVSEASTIEGLGLGNPSNSKTHAGELAKQFALLDRDSNGRVEAWEAAAGFGKIRFEEVKRMIEVEPAPVGFFRLSRIRPVPYHPSSFVDWVAFRVREALRDGLQALNDEIDFEEEILSFLGKYNCEDLFPLGHKLPSTCGELLGETPNAAKCKSLTAKGFCRYTCGVCTDEINGALLPSRNLPLKRSGGNIGISGDTESVVVLMSSDWHTAPWYQIDGKGIPGGQVTRYRQCTYDNEWQCFSGEGDQVQCNVTGKSDPPREFVVTHIEAFSQVVPKDKNSVFFFIGDTQEHDIAPGYLNGMDPALVVRDIMNATLIDILRYFEPEEIFYAAGNNDGPHNEIFLHGGGVDNQTDMWAAALVDAGIVTNALGWNYTYAGSVGLSQVDFFRNTGYYVKQVPYLNGPYGGGVFAVITNTNLGISQIDQQAALRADFKRIANRNGVAFLLGHHPWIAPSLVPESEKDIIRGVMSGHIHRAFSTTPNLFTQLGAVSQAAVDTGFYLTTIDSSNDYAIVVDRDRDLYVYKDTPERLPNSRNWKVEKQSDTGTKPKHKLGEVQVALVVIGCVIAFLLLALLSVMLRKFSKKASYAVVNSENESTSNNINETKKNKIGTEEDVGDLVRLPQVVASSAAEVGFDQLL